MTIPINPILFSFGPLAVHWFGVFALLGLGVAAWLSTRALQRQHLRRKLALDALAWALPAGIVGARIVHVLGDWDYYLTNSAELWQLNLEGLSLWGGLTVGGLVFAAHLGRVGTARRRLMLDAVVPYALLGIAIGRVGEFLEGQGQGVPSALPWATQYLSPLAATPDFGVARHPAQLYDALVALFLFAALALAPPKALPRGSRVAIALIAYGGARLVLGAVRLDPAFVFGLQLEQLLAIGSILAGLGLGVRIAMLGGARAHQTETRTAAGQARTTEDPLAA